ncbi:MAG: hypothetical protein U0835_04940 [Isosphaeraceae bacterium]
MTRFSRHLQAIGTALLAAAALLSAAGDASACSVGAKKKAKPAACCRTRTSCGCCKPTPAPAPAPDATARMKPESGANAPVLAGPAGSCACRSGLPTQPARAPEADGTARPLDRAAQPGGLARADLRLVSVLSRPPVSGLFPLPPGRLYLRTARLLI